MSAVHQLLYYSVHTLLFHRGVYSPEEFDLSSKFGETQYILADLHTRNYIDSFLAQVDEWISSDQITHLVLVILAKDDGRTLERWTFNIDSPLSVGLVPPQTPSKSSSLPLTSATPGNVFASKEDNLPVENALKQIKAATTMLADLPTPSVFTLQAYVKRNEEQTETNGLVGDWREGESYPFAKDIEVSQTQLRGVKTNGKDIGLILTSLDD